MTKYKSKSTGFKDLDKALNGIVPGLYVIGAISSLGKTTFVSQIADQMAIEGESVLFFSLEQSRFELVAKSISRETYKISPKEAKTSLNIMQANFSEATYNAVENYSSYADKIRVIEGNFDMDVFKIREIVEMFIQKTHIKPVVVIDYLQILKPINDKMTDKAQVDYNVSELKRISRDNDIPLFVICSFNRENYTSTVDFKSFKESGAIEYGADVVLGLQLSVINQLPNNVTEQRELINKAKSQKVREIDLICLKNRNGKSYFKCRYKYYSAFNVFIEDGLVE
jgi:replicative DNA helicase